MGDREGLLLNHRSQFRENAQGARDDRASVYRVSVYNDHRIFNGLARAFGGGLAIDKARFDPAAE